MLVVESHTECEVLSSLFRGNLCEQLTSRPGRRYDAEQVVYHAADASHEVYYLRSGLVKIVALSADGREVILDIHKPGEIFGLFCLCGTGRAESAIVMEPSEVVTITLANLVDRLSESRDALEGFILTVSQRLTRAYDTIQDLSFDSVPMRLARTLLRLGEEMGHETEAGIELEHYITQEELAQMLSARREVVSTALGRMRERGLVEYSRGGKLTINPRGLSEFVER